MFLIVIKKTIVKKWLSRQNQLVTKPVEAATWSLQRDWSLKDSRDAFAPKTCVYLGSVVMTARQRDSQQGMDLHQFFLKRVLRKKSDKEIVQKGATITEKLVQIEKLFLAGSVPQK